MSDKNNVLKTKSKVYPEYYAYPIPFDPSVGLDAFSPVEIAPELPDVDKKFKDTHCYNRNTKIMAADVEYPYSAEHLIEIKKCSENIFYFICNYAKVITLKGGIDLLKLYQYQKNAIKIIAENRFSIFKFPRQMGKCVDENTKIKVRINGDVLDLTIGQLYHMVDTENFVESYTPNTEYMILTEDGFKDFDGLTTRYTNDLLEIYLSDGSIIKVTENHEIKFNNKFVEAKTLQIGDDIGYNIKNVITDIKKVNGLFEVADVIQVRDTRSFSVNDESAILSNCIDGMSLITLYDNHTKEIFDIEIDELYKFLRSGISEENEQLFDDESNNLLHEFVNYVKKEEDI